MYPVSYSQTPQKKRVINWMTRWKNEHDREKLIHDIVREYQFRNPQLKINYQFFTDLGLPFHENVAEKIVEMIKTGNIEWDIIPVNTGIYREVAKLLNDPNWGEKHLVDFGKVSSFPATQKAFIRNNPAYRSALGSMFIGPYIEGFYIMLWYNKKVAQKLGLEIKPKEMTFNNFTNYIEKVNQYNQKHGTNYTALYEFSNWFTNEKLFEHLFKSAIGNYKDACSETFTPKKQAALKQTLKALEQLGKLKCMNADHRQLRWPAGNQLILDGKGLFMTNGSWMYSHWMENDETKTYDMVPVELPVFNPIDFYLGSFTPQFAVLKKAPNKQGAINMLLFISSPRIADKWVRYTKSPTGIKGNFIRSDLADDQFARFQHNINNKYKGRFHYSDDSGIILGKQNKLLQGFLCQKLRELMAGEITADQAYNDIIEKCK